MKKRQLAKLAFIGITAGLCTASFAENPAKDTISSEEMNSENEGYHLMTEDELFGLINRKTRELYNSLTPEGKKLVLEVASTRCNSTNQCKGLNACKTEKNSCMGQGECKGTGKCAISDKNLAVKLAAKKMAEKRQQAAQPPENNDQKK